MGNYSYSRSATPVAQRLEVYTETLVINGILTVTSPRTSDMLNQGTTEFLAIHEATVAPLGQPMSNKPMETPVMVRRSQVNFLVEVNPPDHMEQGGQTGQNSSTMGRVAKVMSSCYAMSGTYIIFGQCYLHPGTTLENLMQGVDSFIPLTKCTISLLHRPNISWQREVVVLNKAMLTAMYLVPA